MPTQQKKKDKKLREAELDYFFAKALDDPHTRIEFIRKKDRTKQGVMISCKHPEIIDHVIIGFSMCRLAYDDFNKVENRIEKKNFGKMIAFKRAMKYNSLQTSMVHTIRLAVKRDDKVYIPQTVSEKLFDFVQAAFKYYKNCSFSPWIVNTYPELPSVEEKVREEDAAEEDLATDPKD